MEETNNTAREELARILKETGMQREQTGQTIRVSRKGKEYIINAEDIIPLEKTESEEEVRLIYIDGGQGILMESPDFCVSFARVAAVTQSNKGSKEKKTEFYTVTQTEKHGNETRFRTSIVGIQDKLGLAEYFKKIEEHSSMPVKTEGRTKEATEAASKARRIAEIYASAITAREGDEKTIIILDGHLEWEDEGERKALENLMKESLKSRAKIAALAKRTNMLNENGKSVISLLKMLAEKSGKEGAWITRLGCKEEEETETYFVKLHKKSKFVFKLQVLKGQTISAEKIAGLLAREAKDPVFLGYPYGLIRVDRAARVSNREAEYEKTRLITKMGKEWKTIEGMIILPDAHSVLDSMY